MSNRNYDMSNFIRRQSNKVAAQSFYTRIQPPSNSGLPCQTATAPYLGISSYSIMNEVRSGSMTQYSRSDYGGCELISVGCPCPQPDPSLFIPGIITNIQISYGSIILTWDAFKGDNGPYLYEITAYLNGVPQKTVVTGDTTYRFTDLQELKPYTFGISVLNQYGKGAPVPTNKAVVMPPSDLGSVMSGEAQVDISKMPDCLKYIIGNAIQAMLEYIASVNLGPTRSSRLMYLWSSSVAQAWRWVSLSSPINGTVDGWDWTSNKNSNIYTDENDTDKLLWMTIAVDSITSALSNIAYSSKFNCPDSVVNRIKSDYQWDSWYSIWSDWRTGRNDDGSVSATTTLPTTSANWDKTIVVDGTTVSDISGFPAPQEWTRLTVQGKKQGYLTYNWGDVRSICLTPEEETVIFNSVQPKTGSERDEEIDWVVTITHEMGDPQYHPSNNPVPYMNSDLRKLQAEFWAGGPGTVSPPCMFVWLWREYTRSLSGISSDKVIYSLLDLCIHLFEGSRITWALKQEHMEARPIQEIRRRYQGMNIYSWNGSVIKGDQWTPYQEANFVTPPFADFPSGHSHFSKAFALTMSTWFGANISNISVDYCNPSLICPLFKEKSISGTFGSFYFEKGVSSIQPNTVPSQRIELAWNTWDDMASSAGMSRLYGGIHCLTAHEASQSVAELVDEKIISHWNIDKNI